MKTGFRSQAISIGLMLLIFNLQSKAQPQPNSSQTGSTKVVAKNIGGAFELGIDVSSGKIKIYLPSDMAAGDTISGTVVAEPKGNTEEERAQNQKMLNGYVLEIGDQRIPAAKIDFTFKVATSNSSSQKMPLSLDLKVFDSASIKEVANTTLPVLPPIGTGSNLQPPINFVIPELGQQGRPLEISGPFDGDAANTKVKVYYNPLGTAGVSPEKGTETVVGDSGIIKPLAESPRKVVFRSPAEVAGPVELNVKEGNAETKGTYRNLGVSLSAPKVNLIRGEKTTVTVEVRGLEGIRQDVPLQLDTRGVVNMDGGNFQNLLIHPTEIQPGGRYTTTRGITGQQTGGFSVTATVIVRRFDMCIMDDSNPHRRFMWNTFTGDYLFTNPAPTGQPKPPGGTVQPGGTTQTGGTSPTGSGEGTKPTETPVTTPPINAFGTGRPAMRGCLITLSHNAPDRRIFARLDVCTNTGDASVETSSPKTTNTITDKNTADSTCAAAPK